MSLYGIYIYTLKSCFLNIQVHSLDPVNFFFFIKKDQHRQQTELHVLMPPLLQTKKEGNIKVSVLARTGPFTSI